MPPNVPLVDLHCHLLPHLDDGARSWDEALRMARIAVGEGIVAVIATPHQLGAYAHVQADQILDRTRQFARLLQQQKVPLRVLPGAVVRVDQRLLDALIDKRVLTLGDRGRHVLLELPRERYIPIEPLLDQLAHQGLSAVLTNPERNQELLRRREVVSTLVARGCLIQVTAGSLLGDFGAGSREFALWLLRQGLVHALASDAHGALRRRPLLRRAYERAVELVGEEGARRLLHDNPAAIAEGRSDVVSLPPGRQRESRVHAWLPWRRAG